MPATPRGLRRVGERDVVVDDDDADGEAEGAGALGGEAEVQPVAGVVLDDQQAAGGTGDGEDAGEDGVDRRAGEDVAADRRRQHALADEAGVGRLVAGAAAGDQRDLRLVPVGADDDADVRVAVEPREPAAGGGDEAVDRLGDDVFAAVDELGHGRSLSGQAGAGIVEPEGIARADADGVAGPEARMRLGHGDERVVAERKVQAGLVAEALDAGDRGSPRPRPGRSAPGGGRWCARRRGRLRRGRRGEG